MESVTVEEYDGSEIKWYISDYNADDAEETDTEETSDAEESDIADESDNTATEITDVEATETENDAASE